MATSSRTSTAPASSRPWWKRWWVALLAVPALLLVLALVLLFFVVFSRVPLPDDIALGTSVVLDRDGNEVGTLAAGEERRDVTLDQLPEHVPQAVMAAEDRGFYDHRGVSVTGVARALFNNAKAGEITQGGSTITQQYVKNAALTPERTFDRKLKEAALAIKLEQSYSKDEILGFYLSTIYWGRGASGIEAAARTYYGVPAAELTLNQAATLAGIIQAPESLDPLENPEGAERRRVFVLDGMLEQGWIDQATHDDTVAQGLPEVSQRTTVETGPYAYYIEAVRRELNALFGEQNALAGLTIRTEMDSRMQELGQQTVADAVAGNEFGYDSAALVTVDPASGGVRALVGGPDYSSQQYNVAVRGARQIGSTMKPFTLAAFTAAGYSPESEYPAPATIEIGDDEFRNYGGGEYGRQTVREATLSSTNTVYLQMQEEVGRDAVVAAALNAGLPSARETEDGEQPTLQEFASLTLGPFGFTPVEMASAYGTFANAGVHSEAFLVTEVTDRDGNVIYTADSVQQDDIDENVAAVVSSVLQQNVESGTGQAAQIGRPAAGKTGTTNESKDAWFVGYVPQLSTAVWVGNLDATPIDGLTGGSAAAPLWGAYMSQAVEGLEEIGFPEPDLSGLDELNTEPEPCPDGYVRTEAPSEGEDGWSPDVIDDGEDEPCVEVSPSPSPSPSPTPSPTPTPTQTPTLEPLPSPTVTVPPTSEPSPSPTETGTSGGGGGGGGSGGGGGGGSGGDG